MDWLWSIISGAFSGIAQGFLSLFGMSAQERLGRAEVENADLKATVKEKTDEAKLMEEPDKPYGVVVSLFDRRAK